MIGRQAPGTLAGLDVYIQPDQPKMQLGREPCRLPDGTTFDWIKPEDRDRVNAWLRGFFGTTNIIPDGQYLLSQELGFVSMNPRTYLQFKLAASQKAPQ